MHKNLLKKYNCMLSNIANKVAKCNENKLHILVEGFQIVRYIWIKINNMLKYKEQNEFLLDLRKDTQNLYFLIRKRIAFLYGLPNHYYFVV